MISYTSGVSPRYTSPICEIISIGSELLLGHITNTNASYLSRKLSGMGINVYRQSVAGDNPVRIKEAVRTALNRSDIVITTGGLGPTVDDITISSIASLLGLPLTLNRNILNSIRAFFKKRHIKMHPYVSRQAWVPRGSIAIINPVGTAPGVIINHDNKTIVSLPGPPREVIPLFKSHIKKYLKKRYKLNSVILTRTIRTVGTPESYINRLIKRYLEMEHPVTVGIYASINEVDIKITAKAKNKKAAFSKIDIIEKRIVNILGKIVYGFDEGSLEEAVAKRLLKEKLTLSTAESCTGGLIASRLTDIQGSSKYFDRGFITYSNSSKIEELGVKKELILKHGAVSRPVAIAMARGAIINSGCDIAIAVTGIAGPGGGTKNKPVGLVYIALARKDKTIAIKRNYPSKRGDFKFMASSAALDLLRKELGN